MQLIFFLLWVIALGVWCTIVYFIRTQLRTIDGIRPTVNYVFVTLIIASVVFFIIALTNIIAYQDRQTAPVAAPSTPTSTTPPRSIRSTGNEKIY